MPLDKPRKLTAHENYLLKEFFEKAGLKWDDRGDWTQFTEEELQRLVNGEMPF
jgi:hypothetical protein